MIFRYLLSAPILGTFLCRVLYTLNKIHVVRDFGYNLQFMPKYIPRRLLTDYQYQQHIKMSETKPYKSILSPDLNNINTILGTQNEPQTTKQNGLLTVEKLIKSYKSGSKTPSDIIKQSLKAVDKLSHLNIFTQLNKQEILSQSSCIHRKMEKGSPLSILDGIPIVVKDEYEVIGYNTTLGTSFMDKLHGPSKVDNIAVARIRAMGAVIFGKANMHELGLFPDGYNQRFGTTRNPYSVKLIHDTGTKVTKYIISSTSFCFNTWML